MAWGAFFPGQGSQHPGMGKFLWDQFSVAKQTFEEGSDALKIDFKKLCFEGSEQDLALTENTQPCLLLVSTVSYRVLKSEFGFEPKVAAGHSIGEYAAVVNASGMDFTQAMRAVRRRGQAMQSAVPVGVGGMTAVMGVEPNQIEELCRWAEKGSGDTPVQPANLNAPGQIVISGKKSVLDWLQANFKADAFPNIARAKFIPLKVSAPFHCSLMKPAEEEMRKVLSDMEFKDARYPVVQNVNAQPVTKGADLRENLIQQVSRPVRWIECVQKVQGHGVSRSIEIGCGKVISGLVKKIAGDQLSCLTLNSIEDLKSIESALKGA